MLSHSQTQKSTEFRQDITGLRALAVISVILFHFEIPGFAGGFIGVDVFFVISGFLMTSIIMKDLSAGSFSLGNFYWSRFSRIYPPMLTLLIVAGVSGYFFLSPNDYEILAKRSIAGALSLSNVYFWSETSDYFNQTGGENTLLHLWSLAVEVQFYLTYPLLLLIAYRINRPRLTLGVIGLASLVACAFYTEWEQAAAFYLMPFRIWEFLAGAAAFLCLGYVPARMRAGVSSFGVVLILASAMTFSEGNFPGLIAVLPVIGAAFVAGSPSTLILLNNPASSFLGNISYSLYLWHWPVWVTANNYGIGDEALEVAGLFALSIFLATLSYYAIELPVQRLRHKRMQLPAAIGLFAASAMTIGTSLLIVVNAGFLDRAPDLARNAQLRYDADVASLTRKQPGTCFLLPTHTMDTLSASCLGTTPLSEDSSVLVWGDSYAAALWNGVSSVPDYARWQTPILTAASCPPVPAPPTELSPLCQDVSDLAFREITQRQPKVVVLFARWGYYARHGTDVVEQISQTLAALESSASRVVVIGPIPEWTPSLPQRIFDETFLRGGVVPTRLDDPSRSFDRQLDEEMRAAAVGRASYVSLFDLWCDGASCDTTVPAEGIPELTVWDHGHLTVPGAVWLLNRAISPAIRQR